MKKILTLFLLSALPAAQAAPRWLVQPGTGPRTTAELTGQLLVYPSTAAIVPSIILQGNGGRATFEQGVTAGSATVKGPLAAASLAATGMVSGSALHAGMAYVGTSTVQNNRANTGLVLGTAQYIQWNGTTDHRMACFSGVCRWQYNGNDAMELQLSASSVKTLSASAPSPAALALAAGGAGEVVRISTTGNVGIRTTAPAAGLDVNGTFNASSTATIAGPLIMYSGILSSGSTDGVAAPPGAGTRLMWIPSSAAFRAGMVDGTQWNPSSIGAYSAALGKNTRAAGVSSVALGNACSALGISAVALGQEGTASGDYSVILGVANTASGRASLAGGYYSQATGNYALAIGTFTTASGVGAVALGAGQDNSHRLQSAGMGSVAMGYRSTAGTFTVAGVGSVGMGQDVQTTANNAMAFGRGLIANTTDSFNVGFGTALSTPAFQVTASLVNVNAPLVAGGTITANGASIATAEIATATVTGYADLGIYVSKYSASSAALYAACAEGYAAIAGGCHSPYGAIKSSVPSSETVSGTGTPAGVLEGERIGTAWGCVLESGSGATASAICAKVR